MIMIKPWWMFYFLFCFEHLRIFLEWCLRTRAGNSTVQHYLDNFIFARQQSMRKCKTLMAHFYDLATELGVLLPPRKTEGPTSVLIYLGSGDCLTP